MFSKDHRLPLELVDEIVHLSQADSATLKACSLVCSTWNAITRAYIFRRVQIRSEQRLDDFQHVVQASPEVGSRVREIVFTLQETHRTTIRWAARIPRVLPELLPAVRTVRFQRLFDAAEYCDAPFFRQFHRFSTVRTLVLEDCALNMPTLEAFACALPRLERFVVTGLLPLMVNVWPRPPHMARPRFTALTFDFAVQPSATMIKFLEWFERSEAARTVTSLDLAVKALDAKAANHLLAKVGPNLRHLGLKMQALFSSDWEYDGEGPPPYSSAPPC